jgi:hypothetical protein
LNQKSHKFNIKHESDDYTNNLVKGFDYADVVNRNRLFYCAHMNRKNAFFRKHILNQSKITGTPASISNKIYNEMFGFTRMRSDVKEKVL